MLKLPQKYVKNSTGNEDLLHLVLQQYNKITLNKFNLCSISVYLPLQVTKTRKYIVYIAKIDKKAIFLL